MRHLLKSIDYFFFQKISATGFGLMRSAWGASVFLWMLSMAQDVTDYFSNDGILSPEFFHLVFRSEYRFTLLQYFSSPAAVWALYITLLISAFFTCIGLFPRLFTTLTVVLFFSFQERNLLVLGGGDTVLRAIGFSLLLSPELRAFSVSRSWQHWKNFRIHREFLPELRISIWPYRLLLWQALVIYLYSGFEKISGDMWLAGTAVEVFFHHSNFFRWPKAIGDIFSQFSTISSYFTLAWELSWFLLLVPRPILERFPKVSAGSIKRGILLGGVLFHGALLLMSDVGIFPLALFTLYFGLLLDEDFLALRSWWNKHMHQKIAVLYDGKCGLCLRSVFFLQLVDWLQRLQCINFHNTALRKAVAPNLTFSALDKALHIVLPNGRILHGFDALRAICWHIPLFWLLLPIVYLPGVAPIGRIAYARIAKRRRKCTHEACKIS